MGWTSTQIRLPPFWLGPSRKNLTELRGFIGICNYYRSFCPNFSAVIEPLSQMLRKDVPIVQTDERMAAFNALKAMLTTPPTLSLPKDDGMWVVDVDCSAFAIGAVAQQWQNGELKVIEYASRTLNRAERSYCATRRELLAMIFALKHFRSYLLGHHFVCRVDHMALKYYQSTPEPIGQQARFLDFLAEFDFSLEYRPGKDHTNCDSLSRIRPCEVDNGSSCKQCNRRVTGTHVSTVVSLRGLANVSCSPKSLRKRLMTTGRGPPRRRT